MNKKPLDDLLPLLLPSLIKKLYPYLNLPANHCFYEETKIETPYHEAEVYIFKNEFDQKNTFSIGITMYGAVLNAVLMNKSGERRIFLYVEKSIAPSWKDENILRKNFQTVFKVFSKGCYNEEDVHNYYIEILI